MNINVFLFLIIVLLTLCPRAHIIENANLGALTQLETEYFRPVMQRGMYFNNPRWTR